MLRTSSVPRPFFFAADRHPDDIFLARTVAPCNASGQTDCLRIKDWAATPRSPLPRHRLYCRKHLPAGRSPERQHQSTQASAADPGDAAPLQEYGFTRYESARYSRDDGDLTVKAMEFGDATGAYGAFTFYRRPTMSAADIGSGGAFDGTRVLFWSGTTLVDAKFQHITPMSAGELRDLITQLPKALGNVATPPRLPDYLPSQHLQKETVRYAIGPQSYRDERRRASSWPGGLRPQRGSGDGGIQRTRWHRHSDHHQLSRHGYCHRPRNMQSRHISQAMAARSIRGRPR